MNQMKTKLITAVCVVCFTFGSLNVSRAAEKPGSVAVAVDAVIVRPACFAVTVLGTALFLVTLPVAATSKSVKQTEEALILKPGRATFVRPLGDLGTLEAESTGHDSETTDDNSGKKD